MIRLVCSICAAICAIMNLILFCMGRDNKPTLFMFFFFSTLFFYLTIREIKKR